MVSTRRSSFSVPSLPTSSRRPPQFRISANVRSESPTPPPMMAPGPHLPPKPPIRSQSRIDTAPTMHTTNHFLQNINLDGDLLSIPDPPSPSKRHRRRFSSPLQDLKFKKGHEGMSKVVHVPTTPLGSNDSACTHDNTPISRLYLSGPSQLNSEFEPNKRVVRRHSFAFLPSSTTMTVEPTLERQVCALDLSGAMEFSNLLPDPLKDNKHSPSPPLKNYVVVAQDVEAMDRVGLTPYVPSSVKRKRQNHIQIQQMPSAKVREVLKTKLESGGGGFGCRPPRPENSAQRRRKRQSFYVPAFQHVNEEHDVNLKPERTDDLTIERQLTKSDGLTTNPSIFQNEDVRARQHTRGVVDEADECAQGYKDSLSSKETLDTFIESSISIHESITKRSKKRQSIFLPSDSSNDDDHPEVTEFFDTLAKVADESKFEPELAAKVVHETMTNPEDNANTTVNGRTSIRHWIRDYCSLSDEKRGSSEAAKKIEELTGYPIVIEHASPSDASSQSLLARRHALLVKLGPVVDFMDKSKVAEKDRSELETGFRVEKTRNGRFRYFCVRDNMRISPQEYEEQYLKCVKQSSEEKGLLIQKFLQDFENEESHRRTTVHDSVPALAKINMTISERVGAHEVNVEHSDVPKEEKGENDDDDRMDISDSQSPVEPENNPPNHGHDGGSILLEKVEMLPEQGVLPLPPRDDVPMDPDIAEAHHRLWGTIDDAIRIYSREVLAIQEQKGI